MDAFLEIFLGKGEEEMLTLYVTQQTAQNTIFFSPQFTPFGNYHPLCVCFSFFLLILWSPHTCAHTHAHTLPYLFLLLGLSLPSVLCCTAASPFF